MGALVETSAPSSSAQGMHRARAGKKPARARMLWEGLRGILTGQFWARFDPLSASKSLNLALYGASWARFGLFWPILGPKIAKKQFVPKMFLNPLRW